MSKQKELGNLMGVVNYLHDTVRCPICRRTFTDPARSVECDHVFCRECLIGIVNNKKECPLCRKRIPTRRSIVKEGPQINLIKGVLNIFKAYNKDLLAMGKTNEQIMDSQIPAFTQVPVFVSPEKPSPSTSGVSRRKSNRKASLATIQEIEPPPVLEADSSNLNDSFTNIFETSASKESSVSPEKKRSKSSESFVEEKQSPVKETTPVVRFQSQRLGSPPSSEVDPMKEALGRLKQKFEEAELVGGLDLALANYLPWLLDFFPSREAWNQAYDQLCKLVGKQVSPSDETILPRTTTEAADHQYSQNRTKANSQEPITGRKRRIPKLSQAASQPVSVHETSRKGHTFLDRDKNLLKSSVSKVSSMLPVQKEVDPKEDVMDQCPIIKRAMTTPSEAQSARESPKAASQIEEVVAEKLVEIREGNKENPSPMKENVVADLPLEAKQKEDDCGQQETFPNGKRRESSADEGPKTKHNAENEQAKEEDKRQGMENELGKGEKSVESQRSKRSSVVLKSSQQSSSLSKEEEAILFQASEDYERGRKAAEKSNELPEMESARQSFEMLKEERNSAKSSTPIKTPSGKSPEAINQVVVRNIFAEEASSSKVDQYTGLTASQMEELFGDDDENNENGTIIAEIPAKQKADAKATPKALAHGVKGEAVPEALDPMEDADNDIMLAALEISERNAAIQKLNLEILPAEFQQESLKICISGFAVTTKDQMKIVKNFASQFKIAIVKEIVDPQCTCLVVATPKSSNRCDRTLKYIQALATRKWIVGYKWTEECLAVGKIVHPSPFEVEGDTSDSTQNVPRMYRLQTDSISSSGFSVFFLGDFSYPGKGILEEIAKYVNLNVLKEETDLVLLDSARTVVVKEGSSSSANEKESEIRSIGVKVVSKEWLLASVCNAAVVPLTKYLK